MNSNGKPTLLDRQDVAILQVAEADPADILHIVDIQSALAERDPPVWLSDRTIGRRCDGLRKAGYLERPPGRKARGNIITQAGRERINR